jgi:hypothetical protein
VSAFPAQSSIAGRSPTADRHRFLRRLIEGLRTDGRALIFHGRASDPHWGWRDDLARVFLDVPEHGALELTQAPETREPLLLSQDAHGRIVLFTRALSGTVRNEYLECVQRRVHAANGTRRVADERNH